MNYKHHFHNSIPILYSTHRSFLCSIEKPSAIYRVCDVEGVVIRAVGRVIPSVDEEGVRSPSLHHQLWDDCAVDEPGNAPPGLT